MTADRLSVYLIYTLSIPNTWQIRGRRRHRYTLVEEAISCIWLLKDSGYILPLLQILLMPQEKKKRYTAQLCVLQATCRIYSRKRTENYVPLVLVQLPSVRWRLFRREDSQESWFLAVSSSSSPAKYTIAATPHTHTHTHTHTREEQTSYHSSEWLV